MQSNIEMEILLTTQIQRHNILILIKQQENNVQLNFR